MDWLKKLKEKGVSITEETVSIDSIFLDPNNANVHPRSQIEKIKKSLETFGQPERLVVAEDGRVIGGNGRLEAMRELNWETVRITRIKAKTDFLNMLGLALNRTSADSYLDESIVKLLLADVEDVDLMLSTGYSKNEIDLMLGSEKDDDFFEVDELPEDKEDSNKSKPSATSNNYSSFEIVMKHSNKSLLVNTLNEIRIEMNYDNLEDSLMYLVNKRNKENKK